MLIGGCLCGDVRYEVQEEPAFPHLCSCHTCQKWSGAPTVAWFDVAVSSVIWTGATGEPTYFRSSANTLRGSCRRCGTGMCARDDGSSSISITVCSLDDPSAVVPDEQHSFNDEAPGWWQVTVKPKGSP